MKVIIEYMETALSFERMADEANDARFKTELLKQADGYRALATKRSQKIGVSADFSRSYCPE